ncbi:MULTISPECIES: pyridoxamine 5'-phosphate oxidase family protein [Amycolatopsis]|uniref:Pyridoxamine 5'-phosphate oxidase n=1 Tax=Amycolatopsis dongchuanensis TaxID=1070866 RepID=A0ABP9QMZ9_9PSEU
MFDPSGLEVLDRAECLALLATADVGRVVFTSRGLPAVQPVRFCYGQDAVWFPAEADTDLFGAAQDGVVAFEVDAIEPRLDAGWWITVLGRAGAVSEREVPWWPELASGSPAGQLRCVRVPVEVVSGRRVKR